MLKSQYTPDLIECGCDEAGRGCLAGAVFAAAVILPKDYSNATLNDSKQLTERQRYALRTEIEHDALAWAVASVSASEIDKTNILRASMHAMNMAVAQLDITPELLLIDGNRFYNEGLIPYFTIVKGDGKYMSIAAASILAKTYRDDYAALAQHGPSPVHRMTFKLSHIDSGNATRRAPKTTNRTA